MIAAILNFNESTGMTCAGNGGTGFPTLRQDFGDFSPFVRVKTDSAACSENGFARPRGPPDGLARLTFCFGGNGATVDDDGIADFGPL